jgi:hypothetical protein
MITMKNARAQYADRKVLKEAVYEREEGSLERVLKSPRVRVRRGHHVSFRVWARAELRGEMSPKLARIVGGVS